MSKANYYDWTGDVGFYSVCSGVMERRARRAQKARVRRVRGWMYRRAARQAVREVCGGWVFGLGCSAVIGVVLAKLFY